MSEDKEIRTVGDRPMSFQRSFPSLVIDRYFLELKKRKYIGITLK